MPQFEFFWHLPRKHFNQHLVCYVIMLKCISFWKYKIKYRASKKLRHILNIDFTFATNICTSILSIVKWINIKYRVNPKLCHISTMLFKVMIPDFLGNDIFFELTRVFFFLPDFFFPWPVIEHRYKKSTKNTQIFFLFQRKWRIRSVELKMRF